MIKLINSNVNKTNWKEILLDKSLRTTYRSIYKNMLNDPDRNMTVINILRNVINDLSTKKIIIISQFRKSLETLYELINKNIPELKDDIGIYYAVTKKSDIKKVSDTLNNKRIILCINSLGKQSLNIKECNCLILVSPPIIHKDINDKWNCQLMIQLIGRCMRKNWKISPKIFVINDMFSFFVRHMKLRKIFFKDIKKWKIKKFH